MNLNRPSAAGVRARCRRATASPRCFLPATRTMRISRCTCTSRTPPSASSAAPASSAIPARTSAQPASMKWSRTARAAAVCRSTPPTACTARPATSKIRTKSSPGPRPRAAPDRTTKCSDAAMSPIWSPSPKRAAATNLARFMDCVNARQGLAMVDYADVYRWSIDNPALFWAELARFADVRASCAKDGPVIENPDAMPGARFFPSARLNFAENLLRYRDAQPAIVFRNERGARSELSYGQLYDEVARVAAGLKEAGVVAGDRVAAFLPNLPETAIAMLATASLGAIWSSCSPDFGLGAVVDRFGQIAPKVLFAADGYFYGGKTLDSLGLIAELLPQLPSVAALVVVSYASSNAALARIPAGATKVRHWREFGIAGAALKFLQCPF